MEADLKRVALRVVEKARELCAAAQVADAEFEALEGDARNVLCDAVERHHAEMLVVGSHGYGAIKRYGPSCSAAMPSSLTLLCYPLLRFSPLFPILYCTLPLGSSLQPSSDPLLHFLSQIRASKCFLWMFFLSVHILKWNFFTIVNNFF